MIMSKKMGFKKAIACILIFTLILQLAVPLGAMAASDKGLNIKKATILVGNKITLSLKGEKITKITSKNPKIAEVKPDGTVKGKKVGTTTITVIGQKKVKYKCTIKVKAGLAKSKVYLTKGHSTTIKLRGTKIKNAKPKNKALVSVTTQKKKKTVKISAKKVGTTKIRVKGQNGKTYTCTVIVENPSLQNQLVLAKGDKQTLKLENSKQKVTWTSSDSSVAKVSKGKVTSVSAGTAVITARDASGKTYLCKVRVEKPKITSNKLSLKVGQSAKLSLSGNTQKITWKSKNKKVASVSSSGKVKALAVGKTKITAAVKSGAKFRCTVTVTSQRIRQNRIREAVKSQRNRQNRIREAVKSQRMSMIRRCRSPSW